MIAYINEMLTHFASDNVIVHQEKVKFSKQVNNLETRLLSMSNNQIDYEAQETVMELTNKLNEVMRQSDQEKK